MAVEFDKSRPQFPARGALHHKTFHHHRALGGRRRQLVFIDHSFRDSREFFAPERVHASFDLPFIPKTTEIRTLDAFWPLIRDEAGSYAGRRRIISNIFAPLCDHLEGRNRAPSDHVVSTSLESFDAEGVHAVWSKALERRNSDPDGAITIARTLLETVCKRILDQIPGSSYTDKEDLPKLYGMVARALNLARNRLSDSHGRGGKPVRPSPRHASLAVNLAGGVATFLVETFLARKEGKGS